MVVPSLRGGGLERLVRDLCVGLVPFGVTPAVFAVAGLGVHAADLEAAGVEVHDVAEGRIRIRGLPLRLIAALRRFRPDVIHAHSGTWLPASSSAPWKVIAAGSRPLQSAPMVKKPCRDSLGRP